MFNRFLTVCLVFILTASAGIPSYGNELDENYKKAQANGEQAQQAFTACMDFVHGWLAHRDPKSGLIPRNLTRSWFWNAQDSAADNYPFMVLTCALLNRPLFHSTMMEMLETEQRLTNRLDNLPDTFDFATQDFLTPEADLNSLIFGGSEYVKDGLVPLTEWLGPSPWSERMIGIIDSVWEHAPVETPYGRIPSDSHEVNGEQLQVLARLYWMTGEEKYREWTFRIADYYFEEHLPTESESLQLDDHGCEVVDGLAGAYFLAAKTDPARHEKYKKPMYRMLDRIMEVGMNEDGQVYERVNPITGEIIRSAYSDNWGYNYNAFLNVAQIDGETKYREAVLNVLENIHKYKDYLWENGGSDGYADAIEGGLNLLNRIPVESAFDWLEHSIQIMLAKQRYDGVIEGWHGDGNFARTALMYALWKTQGTHVEPWREDLRFGAVYEDGNLYFILQSDWPWRGQIHFDIPRHREYLNLPADYPRINQFPEWFTLINDMDYELKIDGQETVKKRGVDLIKGLDIQIEANQPIKIQIMYVNP